MVKRTLCTALSVALICAGADFADASAPATQESPATTPKPTGEVRLQSGGFIRGEIIQYMPGEYVIIVPTGETEPRRMPGNNFELSMNHLKHHFAVSLLAVVACSRPTSSDDTEDVVMGMVEVPAGEFSRGCEEEPVFELFGVGCEEGPDF